MGLDYLHSECHIIHIGELASYALYAMQTKVSFNHSRPQIGQYLGRIEDPSVIDEFVQAQAENPMPRKFKDGRSIYQSHNDFGPLKSLYLLPKIADFGLAQRGDSSQPQLHPIQPDHYRAPEVILGTGWTYSADICNFGVLVCFFNPYYKLIC